MEKKKGFGTIDFDSWMREYHSTHPDEVPVYLQVAFEESCLDGDWGAFLRGLRHVCESDMGLANLARQTGRSRTSLYKTLSENGNPRLDTVQSILEQLGLTFAIVPLPEKPAKKSAAKKTAKAPASSKGASKKKKPTVRTKAAV